MKTETTTNKEWTEGTNVTSKELECCCGKVTTIYNCSDWHNGKGVFYCECECGQNTNVSWKLQTKQDIK